jgi:hypothetical protein
MRAQIMRATKISVAVIAAIAMGSTPGSSLDVPSKITRHDLLSCTASGKSTISLVGARDVAGIVLISSSGCDN